MNESVKTQLPKWLPFVVGAVLVAQFAALSVWQVSRGFEKLRRQEQFAGEGGYSHFHDGAEVRPYQRLQASGRYDGEHQVLLDNIILNSRYGYYVLTPIELADDEPLLIVNRGWIEKTGPTPDMTALADHIAIGNKRASVRGRVGALPRPGMRMGDAILPGQSWPMTAVYPRSEDIETALGRNIQPFVLLMDPEAPDGFLRHWVPQEMGPSKHFGYALQWFAMGAVLAGLLVWHYRKRSLSDE